MVVVIVVVEFVVIVSFSIIYNNQTPMNQLVEPRRGILWGEC